ncbi:uncharacterized protein LOC121053298 [Oryza brachyantha]|uniref:TF-B3 domain-containing protein n=1 Tax=Oryza brachyantha TaxID=4533 RepID=J3L3X7_ORYBR|nr:uncharacterized protein LOC121053298 [Oryza brachyantha]
MAIDGEKAATPASNAELGSSRRHRKRQLIRGSAGERQDDRVLSKIRVVSTESSPNSTNGAANRCVVQAEDKLIVHEDNADISSAPVIGNAVRTRLAELSATAPWFIARKVLQNSDARREQSRLQLSCKGKDIGPRRRLEEALTEAEKALVRSKNEGLEVTALDRRGREYSLNCRYLESAKSYRFIQNWVEFLRENNILIGKHECLNRRVEVELWAFRSRELRHATGNKDAGHQDGALGFIVLHKDEGDEVEQQQEAAVGAPVPDTEEKPARTCPEKGEKLSSLETLAAYVIASLWTGTRSRQTKHKSDDDRRRP